MHNYTERTIYYKIMTTAYNRHVSRLVWDDVVMLYDYIGEIERGVKIGELNRAEFAGRYDVYEITIVSEYENAANEPAALLKSTETTTRVRSFYI